MVSDMSSLQACKAPECIWRYLDADMSVVDGGVNVT